MGIMHTKVIKDTYLISSLSDVTSDASPLPSSSAILLDILDIAFSHHKYIVIVLTLC